MFEHVERGKNTLKYMKNMDQETKGRTILRESRWNTEKERYQPGGMERRSRGASEGTGKAPEWGCRGVGRGPLCTLGAPGTPTHCQGQLAWETLCSGELPRARFFLQGKVVPGGMSTFVGLADGRHCGPLHQAWGGLSLALTRCPE